MNLNQLHYFVTLAHMEHYTRAAQVLSITQPSLTHAITALEEDLGTYLFEKKGRNVILTKYGKVFLEYVEESLAILDSGIKKTKALTSLTSGRIDLGYIYTLGTKFVPKIVSNFLKFYSAQDIQFQFTVGNTTDIIQSLKTEKTDIAFCSRKREEKDIEFIPIVEEQLVVVVPKNHPLCSNEQKEIDLMDIMEYPQVLFTKTSGLRPMIDDLFRQIGKEPITAYEVEEDGAMAGLVAEHFGISVMPEIPVLKSLPVNTLRIRHPENKRYIYMAVVKNRYMSPIVNKFYKYIQEKCKVTPVSS